MRKLKLAKDLAPSDEVFEVDRIMSHRVTAEGRVFRVRWKGYQAEDDSWVAEDDFTDNGSSVAEYFERMLLPGAEPEAEEELVEEDTGETGAAADEKAEQTPDERRRRRRERRAGRS